MNFEKEFKRRVDLKTNSKLSPDRLINQIFKYNNLKNLYKCNFDLFKKILIGLGIMEYSQEEVRDIFDYYINMVNEEVDIEINDLIQAIYY